MKLIVSGYLKYGETMGLYNVSPNMKHRKLDHTNISSPTFIIYGDGYYFTYEKGHQTTIYSYNIVGDKLEVVDKKEVPIGNLTHISYSTKHKILFGVSYSEGTLIAVRVENGQFKEVINFQKQINDERLSRPHQIILNENEDEIAVVNISLDAIYFYEYKNERLRYKDVMALPEGSGPRHGLYYDGYIYVVTEYSNEVFVINRKEKKIIQSLSTVPNFKGVSNGATLILSLDKKFLYVSNRGEDSIAKFEVLDNFELKYINSFSCGGKHPRHMILSKDGKYIISCNKDSNSVTYINLVSEEVVLNFKFGEPSGVVEVDDEEEI